jgi:hypothetical protein
VETEGSALNTDESVIDYTNIEILQAPTTDRTTDRSNNSRYKHSMTRKVDVSHTNQNKIESHVAIKKRNKIDISKIKNRMGIANRP